MEIPHIAYRIRTTLSIAVARLADLCGLTVWDDDGSTLALSAQVVRDDARERAYISLRLESYTTQIEGWEVHVERNDALASWQKGGTVCHAALSGEMIGAPGDERAAALAIEEVRRLLPQLQARLARHNWERPHVHIDIAAVRADEVVANLTAWQRIPAGALGTLAAGIKRIWPDAVTLPAGGLPDYPTRADDERLMVLDKHNREIIARVNQGMRPAQIARVMGMDAVDAIMRMNKRISRLRKQYPQLVRPGVKRDKKRQVRGLKTG